MLADFKIYISVPLRVSYIVAVPQWLSYSVNFQLPNEWSKSCKVTYYGLAIPEILFQNYFKMARI